jgi:8-oxo-dGTP pyrophosphatase MutT (NUDIX family)
MGAGLIPFCVTGGRVGFLFQKTFTGRKVGYLIDFGGGVAAGETCEQAAVREFIEETETMFFAEDIRTAARTPERIESQCRVMQALLDNTLRQHPDWWCQREAGNRQPPRDWRTFFVEVAWRDVSGMNREWEQDDGKRFKKRRELLWVSADALHDLYENAPQRLWKRVRQLQGARETIRSIRDCMEGRDSR